MGRIERRVEEPLVPDALRPAGLGNQLGMQKQNVALAQVIHSASFSNAARCLSIRRNPAAATSASSASDDSNWAYSSTT